MKKTIESLQKLVSNWRDTAVGYNRHGEYAFGHSFYTCANELEAVIKQASQPTVEADTLTTGPCSKCGMPREIHRCYNPDKSTA